MAQYLGLFLLFSFPFHLFLAVLSNPSVLFFPSYGVVVLVILSYYTFSFSFVYKALI
jgi:hypothetical protein